jgi:hypothetical protein
MSWRKNRPKCSPAHFCKINAEILEGNKVARKIWATSVSFKNWPNKQLHIGRKFAQSDRPGSNQGSVFNPLISSYAHPLST